MKYNQQWHKLQNRNVFKNKRSSNNPQTVNGTKSNKKWSLKFLRSHHVNPTFKTIIKTSGFGPQNAGALSLPVQVVFILV